MKPDRFAGGFVMLMYVLLIGALVALTVRMAAIPEAGFSIVYTLFRFLILFMVVLMGLFGFNKSYLLLTVAILGLSLSCNKLVFGSSIESYLYERNKALYHETAREILDKAASENLGDHEDVSAYLQSPSKRLANSHTFFTREKAYKEIQFGIRSSIARPRFIVYTTDMKAFLSRKNPGDEVKVLDKNWCILHYLD